jgi:hypothetical protein
MFPVSCDISFSVCFVALRLSIVLELVSIAEVVLSCQSTGSQPIERLMVGPVWSKVFCQTFSRTGVCAPVLL